MSSEQVGGLIAHRNRVVYSHHAHGQASDLNHTYDATYTVNEDRTGTPTYPWGALFDLFIDPGGDRFAWVLTVPDQSDGLSGVEQRVTYERVGA